MAGSLIAPDPRWIRVEPARDEREREIGEGQKNKRDWRIDKMKVVFRVYESVKYGYLRSDGANA